MIEVHRDFKINKSVKYAIVGGYYKGGFALYAQSDYLRELSKELRMARANDVFIIETYRLSYLD